MLLVVAVAEQGSLLRLEIILHDSALCDLRLRCCEQGCFVLWPLLPLFREFLLLEACQWPNTCLYQLSLRQERLNCQAIIGILLLFYLSHIFWAATVFLAHSNRVATFRFNAVKTVYVLLPRNYRRHLKIALVVLSGDV